MSERDMARAQLIGSPTTLHWILRVAVAACFIGHRSFGDWFSFRPAPPLTLARAAAIGRILRVTTALLLIATAASISQWARIGPVMPPPSASARPL